MARLIDQLAARNADPDRVFLTGQGGDLSFKDLQERDVSLLDPIRPGDVVALVGDFNAQDIALLLQLFSLGAIVVPLTKETAVLHDYFLEAAQADWLIDGGTLKALEKTASKSDLLLHLAQSGHPGLVLFSSGTTGRPKAILHDFSKFLIRYETPRPALTTLNFLLFDHIGGINTLLHTLYNNGVIVAPRGRSVPDILQDISDYQVEVLPATPTFLRMLLLSGALEEIDIGCLKVITYGTERMDQGTLDVLSQALPRVDFRQTFGMSELGILRVKSKARDSLWMQIGGEGVETRVQDGVLQIHSKSRMLGYLNAPDPFFEGGWYDTGDLVVQDGVHIRVTGRRNDVINVGGLKVLPEEIERVALQHPDIAHALAKGVANPITGEHIEVVCQARKGTSISRKSLRAYFKQVLPPHQQPQKVTLGDIGINHRFKRTGS